MTPAPKKRRDSFSDSDDPDQDKIATAKKQLSQLKESLLKEFE